MCISYRGPRLRHTSFASFQMGVGDKRGRRRSATIPHSQLSWENVADMWQHVGKMWQNLQWQHVAKKWQHMSKMCALKAACGKHREPRLSRPPVWRPVVPFWLRTNGVSTNGAAAKVMTFDRLGKRVRPGTCWEIKVG